MSNDNAAYFMRVNPYQGDSKKVVFVCSGGILRSATAAHWAAEHLRWNTRSAGIYEEAIPHVTRNLLVWAERIYCMERYHADYISTRFNKEFDDKIKILNVKDKYRYMEYDLTNYLREYFDFGEGRYDVYDQGPTTGRVDGNTTG